MGQCCQGAGQSNTGLTSLQELIQDIVGFHLQDPIKESDQTENFIDLTTVPLTASVINGFIQNSEKSERIFPIGNIDKNKNVVPTKGDNNTVTYSDTSSEILQEGQQSFQTFIRNTGPEYLKKLRSFSCKTVLGVYLVDSCGNYIGRCKNNDLTKLYPIPLDMGQYFAALAFAEAGSSTVGINLTLAFSKAFDDSDLAHIKASDIDVDMTSVNGLIDVTLRNIVVNSVTETEVTADTCFGAKPELIKANGLDDTDFVVEDVNGTPLAISAVTEVDGVYTITHADSTGNTPVSVKGSGSELTKGYQIINTITAP